MSGKAGVGGGGGGNCRGEKHGIVITVSAIIYVNQCIEQFTSHITYYY